MKSHHILFHSYFIISTLAYLILKSTLAKKKHFPHCTKVRFAIFQSGGFITVTIVNPPKRKLAKRTSVHCPKDPKLQIRFMNSAVDLHISVLFIPGLCTKEWSKNSVSLSCYFSFISTDRQTHLASGYWLLSYLYLFSFLQTEFCLQDICSKETYSIYLRVRWVVEFLTCGYKITLIVAH